jgi:hypothetical protein
MKSNTSYKMTAKVGMYHYGRHRSLFGVWVYDCVSETGSSAQFVKDFGSREEARLFVWKMNGWGTPKTALAK